MTPLRVVALLVLVVLAGGSLLATGGYAWYLRSPAYRNSCAADLSAILGLPAEIGIVVPRARQMREFREITVWFPERRGRVAHCAQALWLRTPTPADANAYELLLTGGYCEISNRTWLREDYRRVLDSGLRPGFDPGGPEQVQLRDMDLTIERDRLRIELADASGLISFTGANQGQAALQCVRLNGHEAGGPVHLDAAFSPTPHGVRLDQVVLRVPELPVAILRLAEWIGAGPRQGRFSGSLHYTETDSGRELRVAGELSDILLAECTAPLIEPAWHGRIPELALEELVIKDGWPQRLRCHGAVLDAVLGDILAPWGFGALGGTVVLRVQAAELSGRGVERVVAAGRCAALSLDELSRGLGYGRMSGRAELTLDDFTIAENRLQSAAGRLQVPAAEGAANWIDRGLLLEGVRRALGLELPELVARQLPEQVEYTALGVRFEVKDELLYLFGTHGPREQTILTLRLAGREFPVIREPEQPIDLRPHLDALRTRLAEQLRRRLQVLQAAHSSAPPASQAANEPAQSF